MIKVKLNNKKGLKVVGNYFNIGSKKIVILAHGFTNDKSSNGRFDIMSFALNDNGYDALAIDFTGSGESDDAAITLKNQRQDLETAIDFAIGEGYKEIALLGNSFGTVACLRNFNENIRTMVLIGALTHQMHYDWHEFFSAKQMQQLDLEGYFYSEDERKHKITHETLKDFESINQEKLCGKISCPVLLIHGNHQEDSEELELLKHSKNALQYLPSTSALKIIENGKHGFRTKWHEVIDLTIDWLSENF